MSKQPLAEVFGFPITNLTSEAERYRKNKLCPYNNRVHLARKTKRTIRWVFVVFLKVTM
jgi:hypothetical protein